MSAASKLVNEALNLDGEPDYIDPEKRRRLETGEHPYAGNQALSQELVELIASESYVDLIRKVWRYTGVRPRGRQTVHQLMHMMQDAMSQILRIERGHERRLEQAAVALVLGLPEFKTAQAAVDSGKLRIKASLTPQGADITGAKLDPEPDGGGEEDAGGEEAEEGFSPDQTEVALANDLQELDLEAQKRRFTNLMIQGCSMHKNYAFHMADELLGSISPRLLNLYGVLMSTGELAHWIMPEQAQAEMMSGSGVAGGSEKIEQDEEGVPTIYAQGIAFPVLVQEITKGLMEYLSHSDKADPAKRKHAHNQADTLRGEVWDIKVGGAAWKRILAAIGDDNQELMPAIYDHVLHLPTEEHNRLMQQTLRGDRAAIDYYRELAQQIREEADAGESAFSAGDETAEQEDVGGDEGDADWWKKESAPAGLVNRLLEQDA